MGGDQGNEGEFFCYDMPEERIPVDHPLRRIKKLVDAILTELSPQFDALYASAGRSSILPGQLLRAFPLQVLYTIRSERMLIEQLDYSILFGWFVGLTMDDPVWNHSTFSNNRDRLMRGDIAGAFFSEVRDRAEYARMVSDEHFTVDGTLIQAWASLKRFTPREGDNEPCIPSGRGGRNERVSSHSERHSNEMQVSQTDPDARLFRKGRGREAKLSYMVHALMENRNRLVVNGRLAVADGIPERIAALEMIDSVPGIQRITVGADKGYDTADFIEQVRQLKVIPHVASKRRGTHIDARTTEYAGYFLSQKIRKRIEEIFGWIKTVGTLSRTRHRGLKKVSWVFTFTVAAFNLARMQRLLSSTT